MDRKQIITEVKKYFIIQELVCQHTYSAFGDLSWQFLDTELLQTLLILRRDVFKGEMYINNWFNYKGGELYDERGFRCNICDLCKQKTLINKIYLTAHANGAALDCEVKGLTAQQARDLIKKNQSLLPSPIRLESGVLWLHFDIYDPCNGNKVNEFSA